MRMCIPGFPRVWGKREVLNVYGGFLIIFERIFCRSEKML